MAVITPDTFSPLRRYVGVRLQQGVPIVDADWNELEDVRRFELRAFLKWFVGDGVPYGTDGFRIEAFDPPVDGDFHVRVGAGAAPVGASPLQVGLGHVGRCLVDGLDVLIQADTTFRGQPLHASQPGSAALAAQLGTAVVADAPAVDGPSTVVLDVWEHLVTANEDPSLVFAGLGTESCARVRRQWAVRVRAGLGVPAEGDGDHEAGHVYYALAHLDRRVADGTVYPGDLTDQRHRRLLTPPATLIEDVLGAGTVDAYRRGEMRPALPLRDAINALLRGELPATDDQQIAPDPSDDDISMTFFLEDARTVVALWHSERVAGDPQVFAVEWSQGDLPSAATNPTVQITSGVLDNRLPAATRVPAPGGSEWILAYETRQTGPTQRDIHFRRAATLGGLPAAAQDDVAVDAALDDRFPFVLRVDDDVVFVWNERTIATGDRRWRYRRRRYDATWAEGAATWVDAAPLEMSAVEARPPSSVRIDAAALEDGDGRVVLAFRDTGDQIVVVRLDPATNARTESTLVSPGGNDEQPWLAVDDTADQVWVFWVAETDGAVYHQALDRGTGVPVGSPAAVPTTVAPAGESVRQGCAILGADGGLWLFWVRDTPASGMDIWVTRRDPRTGAWGQARPVVVSTGDNQLPSVRIQADGALWLFFQSSRDGNDNVFFKRIVTAI